MKLLELLSECEIIESNLDLEIEIDVIVSDSRRATKNSLFVAINGESRDGNEYIEEALLNGALAVVTDNIEKNQATPHILVPNAREALSKICAKYYGNPTDNMKIIAITGTNGKTSTANYLFNILKSAKKKCGLISTIACMIDDVEVDICGGGDIKDICSAMTTPDPSVLYSLFYKMKQQDIEYIVLEVSSHAIKQKRLSGIKNIDLTMFTNLSHEHLDYHKTMQDYFNTKESLIKNSKAAIINIDDEYGNKICKNNSNCFSFSKIKKSDFKVNTRMLDTYGSEFELEYNGQIKLFKTHANSDFMISNIGMAIAASMYLKIDDDSILSGIRDTTIKGRMEKYKENIYIDYAHTPIAVATVLKSIKSNEKNKKIIALFGCGGERDKEKRAKIGKIVSKYADLAIITSDNSRKEEPLEIIKDILRGFNKERTHIIIPDRKEAILYAIRLLNDKTVIVLLGKGHENYQINKDGKHYFSERDIIDKAL